MDKSDSPNAFALPQCFSLTQGGAFRDERGSVRFVNGFDLAPVRRLYCIRNSAEHPFRGWVAHKVEHKWFFPASGVTAVHLVQVDSYEEPSPTLHADAIILDAEKPNVLHVPGGYAIGIESRSPEAAVMVFSDCLLNERTDDVWRWEPEYWSRS